VAGYTVTSNMTGHTDKSIFLPAVGYRLRTNIYHQGTNGYYWTASLARSGFAIWLVESPMFTSSRIGVDYGTAYYGGDNNYCGFPVRAVTRQ